MAANNEDRALERINVYMPAEMRDRLKRAAAIRGTSENATAVKLLEKGLDWFEDMSREQREAV